MAIDLLDSKILSTLEKNSRLSTAEISKILKVPQTTIYYRMKRLEEEKVILRYTIDTNNEKVNKAIMSYVLVLFDTALMKQNNLSYQDLSNKLKSIDGVEEFAYISGQYDIIIKVTAANIKELNSVVLEKLRRVPGVLRSESLVVMDYFKSGIPTHL